MTEELSISVAEGLSPFFQWGLNVISAIQLFKTPALTDVMIVITNLVSQTVFFAVIMVLFWVVNEKKALRLGLLIVLSSWVNTLLKELCGQPRPFHLDRSLGLIFEEGCGFPSGHSQLIVVFLVPLAVWMCRMLKRAGKGALAFPVLLIAVLGILLVSFSRLYLGVHFPQDIAGGWLLGGLSLLAFFLLERRNLPLIGAAAPAGHRLRARLVLSALIALGLNALVPAEPLTAALFFGFAAGYALMRARFSFTARAGLNAKTGALRLAAGFLGAVIVYLGLKMFLPGAESSWYRLFRFARYAALGFWVSAGAPFFFAKLASPGGGRAA